MADAKTTKKASPANKASGPVSAASKAGAAASGKKAGATGSTPAGPVKGTRVGVVESDKRSETRTVVVNYMSQHPKYGKYIRQRTVLQVHDASNESKLGDVVEVAPCRPVSKSKTWRLVKVVERRSAQAAALASAKTIRE